MDELVNHIELIELSLYLGLLVFSDKYEKAGLIFPYKWGTGFLSANLNYFVSLANLKMQFYET